MNPMMMLLQKIMGPQAQEMMNKWENMSPQEKEIEMSKVKGMSESDRNNILKQNGVNPQFINSLVNNANNSTSQRFRRKFNY